MNTWKSYMWTADEDVNMKAIFAVMNTTRAVVKIRPEKNSGLYGIWIHDLCNTGAVLYQLSWQANWKLVTMLVPKNPWSNKAGVLIGRLMCSDGGTKHGRDVTVCFSQHNLRKNRNKFQVQMLRKWRKNSQILIWSLSSPLNKAKERKSSALCLRNKMRSKCFSR